MNIIYRDHLSFEDLWSNLIKNDIYQYPLYSKLEISYQKLYFADYQFTDLSFLIEERGTPLLGIIISKRILNNNTCEFSGFGRPVYYLENENASKRELKGARKKFKEIIETYLGECIFSKLIFLDFLLSRKLSFFGDLLMLKGAVIFPVLSQIIKIKQSEQEIHNDLRKSYRSLINWGKNNLDIRILNADIIKDNDIDKFRALHIQEAGRETRSRDTWIKQLEMVKQEEAFVVFGYLNNDLVTAAFFSYSESLCYYGVSASVRNLFEKPLSHVILWTAINYAKKLGCSFFEMGEVLYPNSWKHPTTKELGISTFKRGFGGNTYLRLQVELNYGEE